MEVTKVIFRRWKVGPNKSVIALFPATPGDTTGKFCNSYEHVGQHGQADYQGVMHATQPVQIGDVDVKALRRELAGCGYVLTIAQKADAADHTARYAAARAMVP